MTNTTEKAIATFIFATVYVGLAILASHYSSIEFRDLMLIYVLIEVINQKWK